mgnify:CR=1 FL=1
MQATDEEIRLRKGLDENIVREISKIKNEPEWMLDFRLKAYKYFKDRPMPAWGPDLSGIDFNSLSYFVRETSKKTSRWEDLPENIRQIYDKLGIPEAEKKFLGGTEAMFESEVVYNRVKKELEDLGIIFCDTDTAVQKYPEIVKQYIGKVVSPNDNKFAALNSAVWSGGSFVFVPKGVKVPMPLQAYFRINTSEMGQFERTLIIAEEGADVEYIEGCSAVMYSKASLHAAVVEVIAKKNAHVKYTTLQNWSNNVYNLVTKRSFADENAYVEWVDANIGSKVNMKYPSVYLRGENARARILSIALANSGQIQDAGSKVVHMAPNTFSTITSKSIALNGGKANYRGLVRIMKGAEGSKSTVKCSTLLLDEKSTGDTYPYTENNEKNAVTTHEAFVGKINEDQLFYLMSRGLNEEEAINTIVLGFINEMVEDLPMEYALEFNRLIKINMEGAVA